MTGPDRPERLAEVLDDHLAAEFVTRDVDATMATMTADPYLNHVPVLTGGIGREEVRRFYERIFIGHWPADTTMERISRTADAGHVVDELVMSFTHDITMSHLLPGVPPTGKPVRLAVCVVAGFQDGKTTMLGTLQPGTDVGVPNAARVRAAAREDRQDRDSLTWHQPWVRFG